MGNALKFLEEDIKKRDTLKRLEREKEAMEVHEEFAVVTKCDDSTRNTETKLNKSKLGYKDRFSYYVDSPYDGLLIIKNGVKFRLKQLYQGRTKNIGVTFKATPISSSGTAFDISEKSIKSEIAKGRIEVAKMD